MLGLFFPGEARGVGASPPPFPSDNLGGEILDFSSASLSPGSSGTLTVTVSNPTSDPFGGSFAPTTLELQVYTYAYEGSGENLSAGDAWAVNLPALGSAGGAWGHFSNLSVPSLAPGAVDVVSLPVQVPASASAGSYFVRDRMNFTVGGRGYVSASRGYFSDALWSEATLTDCGDDHNCTPVLNLTTLNVSGVLPETAIAVVSEWPTYVLGGILAASILLAGLAGYVAFRRAPPPGDGSSRSGTRSPARRKKAESALGKSRTSDGD